MDDPDPDTSHDHLLAQLVPARRMEDLRLLEIARDVREIRHTQLTHTMKLEAVDRCLRGDGHQDEGHTGRLMALERAESSRTWHLRTLWGAVVALALGYLSRIIGGGGPGA